MGHYLRRGALAAVAAAASQAAWCYEDGAPPGHTGGFGEPDCSLCHSGNKKNAKTGRLTVDGLPEAYTPGKSYDVAIVLQHPDLKSGGFQLAIRTADGKPAGKLQPVSDRTRVISAAGQPYLQHTRESRLTDQDGVISWRFRWQAPDDGESLFLNIAANAANDDLSALGDYIFTLEQKLAQNDNPADRENTDR